MQMRSPSRQFAAQIGLEPEMVSSTGHDEPQQFGGRRAYATTDTGACRAGHEKSTPRIGRTRIRSATRLGGIVLRQCGRLAVRPDVDAPAGEPGGEPRVLPFPAD